MYCGWMNLRKKDSFFGIKLAKFSGYAATTTNISPATDTDITI